MLQVIGIMIGAYIFTRMLALVSRNDTKTGVTVFAIITMIVTVLCVIDLLISSVAVPRLQ
jgi:hypothetical protein